VWCRPLHLLIEERRGRKRKGNKRKSLSKARCRGGGEEGGGGPVLHSVVYYLDSKNNPRTEEIRLEIFVCKRALQKKPIFSKDPYNIALLGHCYCLALTEEIRLEIFGSPD